MPIIITVRSRAVRTPCGTPAGAQTKAPVPASNSSSPTENLAFPETIR